MALVTHVRFLLITYVYFLLVHDKYVSRDELNSGLKKISDWALQWKIKFYPDSNKEAQEVHFTKHRILSNSATLSNSAASLIMPPDFFAFKICSCLSNSPALPV